MATTLLKSPRARPWTPPPRFPATHWTMLRAAGDALQDSSARRPALEGLARLYWKPVYAYLRLRWQRSREEAEDLTQELFLNILEGPFLGRAEPGHGRFRNFLRTHLDFLVHKSLRADPRLPRKSRGRLVSLAALGEDAEEFLAHPSAPRPEESLDHYWRLAVLEEAMRRLADHVARKGRPVVLEVIRRYDLAGPDARRPTYAALARDLSATPSEVGNYLLEGRRLLYQFLKQIVADSVDGPEALRDELQFLFSGGST